jgi:hypothetical protein
MHRVENGNELRKALIVGLENGTSGRDAVMRMNASISAVFIVYVTDGFDEEKIMFKWISSALANPS